MSYYKVSFEVEGGDQVTFMTDETEPGLITVQIADQEMLVPLHVLHAMVSQISDVDLCEHSFEEDEDTEIFDEEEEEVEDL